MTQVIAAEDEAIVQARQALDLDSTNYQARMMIALSLTFQSKPAEARPVAEEVYRTSSFDALNTGLLAGLLARAGENDGANEELITMTGAVAIGRTMYHLVCGEIDAPSIGTRRTSRNGGQTRRWSPTPPGSNGSGPRWPAVARMMNLP